MKLKGYGTALVTPLPALTTLVHCQIENGISLLIPCGTIGEASTLTEAETQRVIFETSVEAESSRGRCFMNPTVAFAITCRHLCPT